MRSNKLWYVYLDVRIKARGSCSNTAAFWNFNILVAFVAGEVHNLASKNENKDFCFCRQRKPLLMERPVRKISLKTFRNYRMLNEKPRQKGLLMPDVNLELELKM